MPNKWYFAGLNAHKILDTPADPTRVALDFRAFTALADLSADDVDLIFACWSQLVFRADNRLIIRGFRAGTIQHAAQAEIVSIIGDHNGIMGALDADGHMYFTDQDDDEDATPRLVRAGQDDAPRLAKVSVAGNFKVAVTYKQDQSSVNDIILIEEFRDLHHFRSWYQNPSHDSHTPTKHHSVPGRVRQLISNQTIFILLTEDGTIYTWGDARFRGLGRTVSATANHDAGTFPATAPAPVQGIAEDRIVRISGGGRTFAALADDGNVYIWAGSSLPNAGGMLSMHQGLQPGELAGVVIEDDNGQPRVFDDVAVGGGHVLLKCPDGRVYAAGENKNGQLAADSSEPYLEDWVEVVSGGCSFIRAGSKMSVIRADLPEDAASSW